MEITIESHVDLSPLRQLAEKIESTLRGRGTRSNTAQAVQQAGDLLISTWTRLAGDRLKRSTGGYTHAIQEGVQYPYQDDPLYFYVENKHKAVILLEEGYAAFDMKRMLSTSAKVRISKKGKKYLIIPFQHGTPAEGGEGGKEGQRATLQTMPQQVYDLASQLTATRKTGVRREPSKQTGKSDVWVTRVRTAWGDHLKISDVGEMDRRSKVYSFGTTRNPMFSNKFEGHYTWKTSPYAGMYKMKTNRGSVYMTFRVMSEDSDGWIHPMQPALHIAADAVEQTRATVVELIGEGVRRDLAEIGLT